MEMLPCVQCSASDREGHLNARRHIGFLDPPDLLADDAVGDNGSPGRQPVKRGDRGSVEQLGGELDGNSLAAHFPIQSRLGGGAMLPKSVIACLAASAFVHRRTDAYRRVRWSWRAATGNLELAALR